MSYICGMESEELRDALMELRDTVKEKYHKSIVESVKQIRFEKERLLMGGNMGVHFPEHDPPSEIDPKS